MKADRVRGAGARALTAALAAALLAGCGDATAPVRDDGLPSGLERGVYPLVQVASQTATAAQVQLYLKRVPGALSISSYQGELTYDAAVLTLDHTDLPPGIIGSTNETAPGHVRFAGASLEGLGDVPVLALRFTRRGEIGPQTFGVKVEELAGADFADLSSQLGTRGPYFHRAAR